MSQDQFPQQPAQPYPPQGQMPQAPMPGYAPVAPVDPGRGLGIAGLILAFLGPLSLIGLILSIVGFVKSRKAGFKNGIALAGIIVGAIVFVVGLVVIILLATTAADLASACSGVPSGSVITWRGQTVQCP